MAMTSHEWAAKLVAQVGARMYKLEEVTRLCLAALFTDGHVLLEGNPGLGKTELVKTLSRVLNYPFGRIQFTPDLMPQDITGTYMRDFDQTDGQSFKFKEGPIFTSLLLADEINRATPKTQSAMLEAMAERQVTVLGETRKLPTPFMVLATQNPIDHEGTYNLPEAQADRFMFKILMPTPDRKTIANIVKARSEPEEGGQERAQNVTDHGLHDYAELKRLIRKVTPRPSLETHIHNLFLASNGRLQEMVGVEGRERARLEAMVPQLFRYGLGPRPAIALMLGAKAWTALFLPDADNQAGDQALAHVAIPALRHRLEPALRYEWKSTYARLLGKGAEPDAITLEDLLRDYCLLTAPTGRDHPAYRQGLEAEFQHSTQAAR